MFSRKLFYILGSSLILVGCIAETFDDPRPVDEASQLPSLEQLKLNDKNLLLARFDPTKFQLRIVENHSQADAKSIEEIHREKNSVLSFNGSFFSPDYQPLGLLVSEGTLLSPLSKSELMNGIFTINQKGQPMLFDFDSFQKKQTELLPKLDFAIQSGPTLLDQEGKVVIDKKNTIKAGRTALGLDKDNNMVLLMMRQSLLDHNNALTLYEFAELASTQPQLIDLGIHSLINLDGGNSSGLASGEAYFPELANVQNVVITVKKDR